MSLRLTEASAEVTSLEDFQQIDSGDFEVVYRRFFPRLVRTLKRSGASIEVAEDVAQDALIKAFQHLDSYDPGRPLWPWLKTIALHLFYDHGRKTAREVTYDPPEGGVEPDWFSPDALPEAMTRLPKRHQLALALRYVDDWDAGQVADFLGISRGAFEQLLFRARRRLRTEYTRLSESALGVALLPRGFRRWLLRGALRIRRFGDALGPQGWAGADLPIQLAAGAMALVTAIGATAIDMSDPDTQTRAGVSSKRAPESSWHGSPAASGSNGKLRPAPGNDPAGSGGVTTTSSAPSGVAGNKVVDRVSDPNKNVRQPEDAQITSIAFGDNGRTAFAAGRNGCALDSCPRVLFRSANGGRSWDRLPAKGFAGETILLPPGQGKRTRTLFAMGPLGLQVSSNGGKTFGQATSTGPQISGNAAISPAFNFGDPTILIGAQTLLRYRRDSGSLEPVPSNLAGPLRPAFAPNYPSEQRIFVGGTKFDAQEKRWVSTVFTCIGTFCGETRLRKGIDAPTLRPDPHYAQNMRLYAFTGLGVFVSEDAGGSFSLVKTPGAGGVITDLAVGSGASLVVTVEAPRDHHAAGVYYSSDSGRSWDEASGRLLENGARSVTMHGTRLFAALPRSGLACSDDGGVTWSRRCR